MLTKLEEPMMTMWSALQDGDNKMELNTGSSGIHGDPTGAKMELSDSSEESIIWEFNLTVLGLFPKIHGLTTLETKQK